MAVKPDWSRKLAHPVKTTKGHVIRTLIEAAQYVLEQEAERRWAPVIQALQNAAANEAATYQATLELERALFAARELDLQGQSEMRLGVPKRPKR